MIVPMKKIFVVMQGKDATAALRTLQDLGVVHVEHERLPVGANLQDLQNQVKTLQEAAQVLPGTKDQIQLPPSWDSVKKAEEIVQLKSLIEQIEEAVVKRQALMEGWVPWGDFDPHDMKRLADQGVNVQLWEAKFFDPKMVPAGIIVQIVQQTKKKVLFVTISGQRVDLPFTALSLPETGLNQMKASQAVDKKRVEDARNQLAEYDQYQASFRNILDEQTSELVFQEALAGMGEALGLVYLKGFCPSHYCEKLIQAAQKEKWAFLFEDPSAEDQVPTLLKNPPWFRLIEPIYNLMNIMPGYRELDISPFFLIFFSIFFGLLIADAGYGFLFLSVTLIAHWKLGPKMKDKTFFYLTYVLSAVTIILGLLTGTVFGTLLFSQVFKPILPWLTQGANIQLMCFTLGAIHLTIPHAWRFINKIPNPMGMLSEIGWIGLLWSSYFLARTLILGHPFPASINTIAVIAMVFIIADIIAQKKDMAVNLLLLVFSVIGVFTDVVSYIRLFAVGLAGVSIADAFNQIALDIGFSNIPKAIFASLILIFVHLFLNLVLAILGVLVHGLRLNILEFSTHLNMEWSGVRYEPLRNLKEAKV